MLNRLTLFTYHAGFGLKRAGIRFIAQHTIRLSSNKTTLHLIVPRTPLNCYSKKCRTSLVLISGHQTAQAWI